MSACEFLGIEVSSANLGCLQFNPGFKKKVGK